MSVLGLGCAPLGGNFVTLTDTVASNIVLEAISSGLNYFDTAPWYGFGRSERTVGDGIREKNCVVCLLFDNYPIYPLDCLFHLFTFIS